ncbi:hypothetical protein JCM12856_27410 [Spirochaeta dissipatitropha]
MNVADRYVIILVMNTKKHTFTYILRLLTAVLVLLVLVACNRASASAAEETQEVVPETAVETGIEFTVTAAGFSAYLFEGPDIDPTEQNPAITLQRGETYLFDNTTGSAHPFFIKFDDSAGTRNALGEEDGISGDPRGLVIFTVPDDAPDQLFYICSLHAGMSGEFLIIDQDI